MDVSIVKEAQVQQKEHVKEIRFGVYIGRVFFAPSFDMSVVSCQRSRLFIFARATMMDRRTDGFGSSPERGRSATLVKYKFGPK